MSEWLKLEDLIATRREELTIIAEKSRAVARSRGTEALETRRGISLSAVLHRLVTFLHAPAFAASTAALRKS